MPEREREEGWLSRHIRDILAGITQIKLSLSAQFKALSNEVKIVDSNVDSIKEIVAVENTQVEELVALVNSRFTDFNARLDRTNDRLAVMSAQILDLRTQTDLILTLLAALEQAPPGIPVGFSIKMEAIPPR